MTYEGPLCNKETPDGRCKNPAGCTIDHKAPIRFHELVSLPQKRAAADSAVAVLSAYNKPGAVGGNGWTAEFGPDYDVPEVFRDLPDHSHGNDSCPSFGLHSEDGDDVVDLRIWSEHPDPMRREHGPGPRFSVYDASDSLYEGDDAEVAREVYDARIDYYRNEAAVSSGLAAPIPPKPTEELNVHRDAARARKATAIQEHFMSALPDAEPKDLADVIERMPEGEWQQHVTKAGQNRASGNTREMVVKGLRARQRQRDHIENDLGGDPFAGL